MAFKNNPLTRRIFITAFCTLTILTTINGQTNNNSGEGIKSQSSSFYLDFYLMGLGSNLGKMEPTFQVRGTKFIYTFEQNSAYRGEKVRKPKKIRRGAFRITSIDSILDLVKGLKDTTIFESNPCIMSGGIFYMTITAGIDTVKYELMNTFDRTALKIADIINNYLPSRKKIWVSEKLIKDSEDCWTDLKRKLTEADKKKKE
jgi:hypothetical protein